jgi:hypothetical protein
MTVDLAFEYDAIPLLHELCAGVPDAVGTLVSECLELADAQNGNAISKDIVKLAYEGLRASAAATTSDPGAETVNLAGAPSRTARLLIQLTGKEAEELSLGTGHVLIGRSKLCDIQVARPAVSRQHALIIYSQDGTKLIDLGSSNGTYVDGEQIKEHSLLPGQTIEIGDCRIEYVMDDDKPLRISRPTGVSDENAATRLLPNVASKKH